MNYVSGFVIAVPKGNKSAYYQMSVKVAAMFEEAGALRTVEGWEEDVPDGTLTDFRRAVVAEPGEAIVFSWIEWPDKATSEAAFVRMRADPPAIEVPFDGKRMIWGGFTPILDTAKT